ncbi:MAG: transglutaminase domain-containing protein [Oscillospiraceae bacterium]|nr:transglutaminase domain-containing protein [Oscillospiraceae bacterium]
MINILFDIINILPIALFIMMLSGSTAGIPDNSIIGYTVNVSVCVLMIFLRHMSRKNKLRTIGIAAAACFGAWLAAGKEGRQIFLSEYNYLWIVIGISAASFAVGILIEKNVWIRRLAALSLMLFCIISMILNKEISKTLFVILLFMICIYMAAEVQHGWKKEGYSDIKEHIARTSPVLLVLCIAVYMLPASDKPYDWQFVKNIYNSASLYISRAVSFITHPREEYVNIGFSDSSGFYDNISSEDKDVLNISCSTGKLTELRLTGCISGEFEDMQWSFDTETESSDRMTDTLETLCAVRKYDEEHQFDYILKTNLHYENLLPNTKFMFAPSKMQTEAASNDNPEYRECNNSLITEKRMTYSDTYIFSHYTFNSENEELITLLNNASPITETEWENTAKEAMNGKTGYSYSDYMEYKSGIYEKYGCSEGVSEEVRKILDEITTDIQGRYEMMKALEEYLGGMEYSTSDGDVPENVQDSTGYLDHFLLSSRKGYCIHYATAFVLMARELGVPCRYVQGYYINTKPTGNITVKQSQAHAWPEVYFDNVGWVPFEPTPGYSSGSGWITSDERSAYYSDYYDEYEEEYTDEEISEKTDDRDKEKAASFDTSVIIISVLSAFGFMIVLYIFSRIFSRLRYGRMENDEKFRYLIRENMRFLGYIGYRIGQGETLTEYKNRICSSQEHELKEYLDFISYYENMIYSELKISEGHIESAERTNSVLRSLIYKGKLRYRIMLLFH